MAKQYIKIRGVAKHNLKHVDINIPRNELVVPTGLSDSGKSSLALDTIYAEGQWRYTEPLSSYARQFLGQMEKPEVESIEGLSPVISIDQKSTNRNPRSAMGTVTETYDYLRLLYARIGIPHCPNCGREVQRQTIDQMVDQLLALPEKTRMQILALVVRGKKGRYEKVLEKAKRSGCVHVRVDGNQHELSEEIVLDKNIKHNIEIIVDRTSIRDGIQQRLTNSLEVALTLTDGTAETEIVDDETLRFSQNFACPDCGISIEEVEPRSSFFNNPFGAYPECAGLGYKMESDPTFMIPDKSLSLNQGVIIAPGWNSSSQKGSFTDAFLNALAERYHFSFDTPFEDYPASVRELILYGTKGKEVPVFYKSQRGESTYQVTFEGLIENENRCYRGTFSDTMKQEYENYMRIMPCKSCGDKRLKKSSLAVTVGGKNIYDVTDMSIVKFRDFVDGLALTETQKKVGEQILKEILNHVSFLVDVGLDYLSLSRGTATPSGSEARRIRLATQIGSGLVGVAYILDEPGIGLHQRDNDKLLATLKHLRDLGNSVLVVEHGEDTMRAADWVVDIGPGAGEHGRQVVTAGTAEDFMKNPDSITGQYLSGAKKIPVPVERRKSDQYLTVKGAAENNLKRLTVKFPLGVMTCVTGVPGPGKSSLVNKILYKYLAKKLNRAHEHPGAFQSIEWDGKLDKATAIDQSPIGRTPRSNPAIYMGVFGLIRDPFAATSDARARGYQKGRFSFNIKGGHCEAYAGDGIVKVEIHFPPDVYVPYEVCGGKRYSCETLEVRYKGKTIYDVLNMTVEEACSFFENVPSITRKMQTLMDVGLSYIRLGQPSTELSGSEAQRIKLATELSRRSTGRTVYILDELTTDLHFADVHKLVDILRRLLENGNVAIVIEHNLDVIRTTDYIIDMGPEGGDGGDTVVAAGTPEEVAAVENSWTGRYLKKYL